MDLKVVLTKGGHRLGGGGPIEELGNRYLAHLGARRFSPGTVRAYAYDLLNFSRFLEDRRLSLAEVGASDLFDWLEWQSQHRQAPGKVVRLNAARGPAPATVNRRVAAVRCPELAVPPGGGHRSEECSAISAPADLEVVVGWSASHGVYPRVSSQRTLLLSFPISARIATGPSR
jgi:hypothetical protein